MKTKNNPNKFTNIFTPKQRVFCKEQQKYPQMSLLFLISCLYKISCQYKRYLFERVSE